MNQNSISTPEQSLDLREELNKYLRYWPWFIISVVILVGAALIYLRYETIVYSTSSTILIKDSKGGSSELAALEQLGVGAGGGRSIDNEIGILKSRRLMENVVRALSLYIRYTSEGSVKDVELYDNSPIKINVVQLDEEQLGKTPYLARRFQINNEQDGRIRFTSGNGLSYTGTFDSPLNLGFATVVVTLNEVQKPAKFNGIWVEFSIISGVANAYRSKLGIQQNERSSILQLSMRDNVPQKARDVLNQLVVEYNKDAIADENLIAMSTGDFIQERLDIILEDLNDVEGDMADFKEERRITNIESEAGLYLNSANEFEAEQREQGMQLELVDLMISYIQSSSAVETLPADLGIEESTITSLVGEYNSLVLQRNKLLKGASEENPVARNLKNQIDAIRGNIIQTLISLKKNLKLSLSELKRQVSKIDSQIRQVPSTERQYRVKSRNQEIKEGLYLFLLQKREENALKQAINVPKVKVVDAAYGAQVISPNRRSILMGAALAGLLIPFGVIYIRRLLNNKIERREDIEKVTKQIPIVGELPRIVKGESDLISENDRSVLAESFRILTTNLQYLLVNAETDGKGFCIYTTSTVKGEGKTFTSINLAVTLANTGKKVVIIGADLRNPQLQRYDTQSKSLLGVSDYLVSNDHSLEKLIHDSNFHPKLKLFLSGSIPPNPSELLRQAKFGKMIAELREQFDYVIVDTAPSMLVADTFLISKYADLILYVTRAGYTEKKLLNFAVDAVNDGKLHDVSFVINDVKTANFGYGNKYGYAYGQEKPSLWERFKKSFK